MDDCRETPALQYHHELCALGYEVKYYDPYVDHWICPSIGCLSEVMAWADVLIVVTNHNVFSGITLTKPMFNTFGNLNLNVLR